jgi:hypothetical protein
VPESGALRLDANVDKATVYVDGKVATTLRDGSAKVAELDEGVHEVAVEADGHKRYEADVSIVAGETETLSVFLTKTAAAGGGDGGASAGGNGNIWKYSFYAGVIVTAGAGGMWAYYGQQAGYLGGSSLVDKKIDAWEDLRMNNAEAAALIATDAKGDTFESCNKTSLVNGTEFESDPDVIAFKDICSDGASAASKATYLGIATGIMAVATGYLGYRAYFGGKSSSRERQSAKKSKKSSRVVVTPHLGPDSIGAGLSLEF